MAPPFPRQAGPLAPPAEVADLDPDTAPDPGCRAGGDGPGLAGSIGTGDQPVQGSICSLPFPAVTLRSELRSSFSRSSSSRRNPRGHETVDQPPSEAMTCPVIQSASSLTSHATSRAVSVG